MKKKYETPQVEKVVFDYAETVVASYYYEKYKKYNFSDPDDCEENYLGFWHGEVSPSLPACVWTPADA